MSDRRYQPTEHIGNNVWIPGRFIHWHSDLPSTWHCELWVKMFQIQYDNQHEMSGNGYWLIPWCDTFYFTVLFPFSNEYGSWRLFSSISIIVNCFIKIVIRKLLVIPFSNFSDFHVVAKMILVAAVIKSVNTSRFWAILSAMCVVKHSENMW